MLTTDRNEEKLNAVKSNGQQEAYLVLSEEELAAGFIRPVRDTYVHVGQNYVGKKVVLIEPELIDGKRYVAKVEAARNADNEIVGWRYLDDKNYEDLVRTGHINGCGTETRMHQKIAETYARDPKFYGATFCCGCGRHIDVNEFVWKGTNQLVGS